MSSQFAAQHNSIILSSPGYNNFQHEKEVICSQFILILEEVSEKTKKNKT